MFGCNGKIMCTFTGKKLSFCGFGLNASWITLAQDFPGKMPVNSMQGWQDTVVVADGDGVLRQCGLVQGARWQMFSPQPPTSVVFKQFLGGRWDFSGDVYMAAVDTDGRAWIVGNPAQGGQWVAPPNLTPPGSGPFGLNANNFMCGFNGTTLEACPIDAVGNWKAVAQFTGLMPVRAMYGFEESLLVIDGNGVISRVGLPAGRWVRDIPQHTQPATLKEVMGSGYDDNGDEYLAALDAAGTAWLVGKPTGGGQWVAPPHLTPPKGPAIAANGVEHLHELLLGVMQRAEHHAGKVKGTALAILGGIVWRAEPGSIRIHQHAGNSGNLVWARIGGRDYAFRYEHGVEQIEIRDSSEGGSVLHRFNDATPLADIEAAFRAL